MRSDLFAQENHEVDAPGNFVKQNSKMMKIELSQGSVKALQGAMVAYQGDVRFDAQGAGGVGKWIKQRVSGEGLPIMRMQGTGEIFLAKGHGRGGLGDLLRRPSGRSGPGRLGAARPAPFATTTRSVGLGPCCRRATGS